MSEFAYPGSGVLRDEQVSHDAALEAVGEFFLGAVSERSCLRVGQAMLRVAGAYSGQTAKPTFLLHINSPGGDVTDGLMLGSIIMRIRREMGIPVNTHVVGAGYSMGLTIAQFGARRMIDRMATVMTHDIQSSWHGGETAHHYDRLEMIARLRLTVAQIFAHRNTAGHNDPQWWMETYFKRGEFFWTRTERAQLGLFDEIVGAFPTP